ncbi:MAG: hypothetical protein Tsb0026_04100 [Sulfuricaulis sp.]
MEEGGLVPQLEQQARQNIDKLLTQVGWLVCDVSQVNIHAECSVAIWECSLKSGRSFINRPLVISS